MCTRSSAPVCLLILALSGCGLFEPEYLEEREVTVGPTLARCYGVGPQSCMVVDGGLFYGGIASTPTTSAWWWTANRTRT